MDRHPASAGSRAELGRLLQAVLTSRGQANAVFDILAVLQSEDPEEIQEGVRTCSRLFGTLLEREELFVGSLPHEDTVLAGSQGATHKYKVWMRHRYHSCCNRLEELLTHPSFQVKTCVFHTAVSLCGVIQLALKTWNLQPQFWAPYLLRVLSCLVWCLRNCMTREQLDGAGPKDTYEVCAAGRSETPGEAPVGKSLPLPPHTLQVVGGLLTPEDDYSLLISQFCEYLEYDDIRYHTMQVATSIVARATSQQPEVPLTFWNNAFILLSAVNLPLKEHDLTNFYVKHTQTSDKWKVVHLKEHRKAFQDMWLGFLQHKLPLSLYKKVLVAMHDSILPHLAQPTLMIDFLTSACDVGGAISLLALNGLFILIHKHNLEYPDFYQKLYGLLDPSIFHVKYRARFFHLADLFLSSSHLPAYLVAAFAKRLARLALTAPPEALLMVLPFICNLLRRHPACRVMVHRPQGPELDADPYDPTEKDPARSHALESCLWELQTLQQHYHPEVSRAASVINQVLSVPEVSIAPLLELTAYEIFEQDLKKKAPGSVPLEFIPTKGLLGRQDDLCTQLFTLS
ncbi:nucleolar complex protein 4 homolog isoform X1 [Onychomys torridus]|uniref:nucleolar complex protein 4 homolog isoform X1 n=1 Tax=Onychomys torridus TaxID=38674 RepID=UPI00167FAD4B|nr:nucleolar complex protein 4 homolog isoform X1 [Onychomys torridus]